ncbi:NDP-hexose 2,3-dehydratase family protein [Streptomyces sp. CB03238]|uniref:NDP-hexose 2,3-dehydratase family protein n=1 Tax=Streptomyces sp. CB03238 TaxID=1907777 RepID=UPI000A0FF01E|nr:NDP-hexose 2,3-dehydratase family protein [Streptomyces sp. CB03238]ORT55511.1 NDP-hexose 2,3-dehydratase [Streptomyces sp. CB03238]
MSAGTAAETLLRPRVEQSLSTRLARSAAATGSGCHLRTDEVADWLTERARAHHFKVERVPLDGLDGWSFAPGTGDLRHHTGRFFSVVGLSVTVGDGAIPDWRQPIIHQPEVGILGILAKEFDGVLHFLMQAKMEPGNRNLLQISPTVQATRSNYQRVHKGSGVTYLEHFTDRSGGRILSDSLQSEHGSWFYRKANRNMLVETDAEVPVHLDYCWLTLGQIGELLRLDNLVNMDARTVISCFPLAEPGTGALRSDTELLSWFTAERARHEVEVRTIPLADVDGWERDAHGLARPDGRYFRVTGVAVEAGSREVTGWSQPLIEPCGTGIAAFLYRVIGGVPHLLVHAKVEAGFLDRVELAPTVQATPSNWQHLPRKLRPPFLDTVLAAAEEGRVRYEAVHSEEGGRFLNAEIRYMFVEADDAVAPLDPGPGYQWATPDQLSTLSSHGHYLNVQARTLLSCVNAGAVHL